MDYKKMIQDFNSGVLNRNTTRLIVAGDDGFWVHIDPAKTEAECLAIEEKITREYGEPGGYIDIVDVLNAVGVRADWV